MAAVCLVIVGCVCRCYCEVRRKIKDLSKTLHKDDKKKSDSGEDVNACVESEVVRSRGAQARHITEGRVSIKSTDSESLYLKKEQGQMLLMKSKSLTLCVKSKILTLCFQSPRYD